MTTKKGFTLVEIVVVIAIFGILSVAATTILLSVIQSDNRASISNQVRGAASRMLEDMTSAVRVGSCVSYGVSGQLTVFESDCQTPQTEYAVNVVNGQGVLTKTDDTQIPAVVTQISPANVAVCADTNSCPSSTCNVLGLSVSSSFPQDPNLPNNTTKRAVQITLTVRQNSTSTRSDFCARTALEDTVTPRNPSN